MNVAILTNFQDLNPGYSLTGIVMDQIQLLIKNGHTVHLLVNEQYNSKNDSYLYARVKKDNPMFFLSQIVPFGHLKDYNSMISWTEEHQKLSVKISEVLVEYFKKYEIDIAFTHDWVFTGWNLPYAGGVRLASVQVPKVAWLHWIHSVPSVMRDWWDFKFYGPQHKLVFPNRTDQRRVAEQYKTQESNVAIIPHIKDIRTWFDMCDETCEYLNDHPYILNAEMVQVYPASSDRLSAKGVEYVIKIFSYWKKHGISCCLVIANQWATGRQRMEDLNRYEKIASSYGLEVGKEFMFTSTYKKQWNTGISTRILRELQLCSSVFIFPTREESFGLVGPEACLDGVLPVFNDSLTMMREIYGSNGMYFGFGSFSNNFEPQQGWDKYLEAVAMVIYNQYKVENAINARSHVRRFYNMDHLYRTAYLPTMASICAVAKNEQLDSSKMNEVDLLKSRIKLVK